MARTDDGDQIEIQLLRRERERIDALVGDNMERFAALLADDLVHVHTTSVVQGKAELLQQGGAFCNSSRSSVDRSRSGSSRPRWRS